MLGDYAHDNHPSRHTGIPTSSGDDWLITRIVYDWTGNDVHIRLISKIGPAAWDVALDQTYTNVIRWGDGGFAVDDGWKFFANSNTAVYGQDTYIDYIRWVEQVLADDDILTGGPEATFATIQGAVAFEGFGGDLDDTPIPVRIEVRENPGGAVVLTHTALLDSSGNFTLPSVLMGTYDIALKAATWLQTVVTAVDASTLNVNIGTVTLKGGDVNGDNVIEQGDYNVIQANWDDDGDS